MSATEKSFRYRAKFGTEITLFVLVMICSVFLTLNHLMSINRKTTTLKEEFKLLQRPKNPQDKKND